LFFVDNLYKFEYDCQEKNARWAEGTTVVKGGDFKKMGTAPP